MKPIAIIGILFVLFGIGTLIYDVIPIHHQEEVAKIGPVTATEDKENDVVIPRVASVLAVLLGGGLLLAGRRT